jgi:hypothetical protein
MDARNNGREDASADSHPTNGPPSIPAVVICLLAIVIGLVVLFFVVLPPRSF